MKMTELVVMNCVRFIDHLPFYLYMYSLFFGGVPHGVVITFWKRLVRIGTLRRKGVYLRQQLGTFFCEPKQLY
jgi:hypothetical protein